MNATATLPPDVADYLDRVRAALADVPAEERDEMLADLEVSLLEGAEDSLEPPEARLGPPESFAQELRTAAGITTAAPPASRGLRDRLRALAATPRARAALQTAHELAPAWWVARGYVAACALAVILGFNWSDRWALIPVREAPFFGALLVLAGISASVWLGLRTRRQGTRGRRLLALNLILAIAALPTVVRAIEGPQPEYVEIYTGTAPEFTQGLLLNGEEVQNIYPYSRDGKLLLDVVLYDQDGHPLDVGAADQQHDPLRRYLFAKNGEPLLNAFPIRYFEPGSSRVKRPLAAPEGIELPEITTPPLKVKRP